ncbi:MAG: hypothetical protein ABIQ93_14445 [Saprospiraceae bacterium]
MRNRLLLYLSFFTLPLNAQNILRQATVHYHVSSSTSPASTDSISLHLYFAPGMGVLSMTRSQEPNAGTFLVLNYESGQSQGFLYANGDTTSAAQVSLYQDMPVEKQYTLQLSAREKKTILGYTCTHFDLIPKRQKKTADRISGWITDRIKTKAVPVTDLYNELPGFPLEVSLRDGSSGATILFTADQVAPLDSGLLEAYRRHVQRAALPKRDVAKQVYAAFERDSTVRLAMPVPPDWTVLENNYRELSLEHKGFKARLQLRRHAPKLNAEVEAQLENLVDRSGSYLRDALHLPVAPLDAFAFREQPAVQRIWRYPNARNYIFHTYPQEQNPYDYFPLTELVEVQRAFLLKDVLYVLQVQTVQGNYEQVMQAVEDMLRQAALSGR